jgi:hypothetical protein
MAQKKEKYMKESAANSMWERTHKRNAARVLKAIIQLEGLWVKLGQYLSTRADVLPEAYVSALRQLQDSLPPRPLKEVGLFSCCKWGLRCVYFCLVKELDRMFVLELLFPFFYRFDAHALICDQFERVIFLS